ncbi:MAG: oligosaccharide flippase family protein [Ardenticatenales bacterium]
MPRPAAESFRRVWPRVRRLAVATWPLALFLVVPLFLFWRQTIGGQTLVPYDALTIDPVFRVALAARGVTGPQNGLLADLVFQNVVWKQFLVDALRHGRAPLWNPYVLGGLPFLAAGQHSAFYPPTLLFTWLGPDAAFGWNALLTLWLAGLFAYALGRQLGLGRAASAFLGVAWSASSLFVANAVFPMIQVAMAFTPLLLAGVAGAARALERPGSRGLPTGRAALWLAITAAATALIALAGHAEILYYAGLVAAAFAVVSAIRAGRAEGALAGGRVIAWLAAAGAVGIAIAGAQLLPFYELAATSHRAGARYADVVGWAFGLRQLATFFVPDFFGNPAHHAVLSLDRFRRIALEGDAFWGGGWGAKNYVESAAYIGLLPWLLAPIGLAAAWRTGGRFWAGLGVAAAACAFGTPFYRLLFALPGIDQLHSPFRWVFPLDLSVVVLAALGLDALLRAAPPPAARTAARWVAAMALATGAWGGIVLAMAWAVPDRWTSLIARALASDADLGRSVGEHFASPAVFGSYLFWALLHFTLFVTIGGLAVGALSRGRAERTRRRAAVLAIATVALDLALIGYGFNPAVDPGLADVQPRAVRFLADVGAAKWGRVVGFGDGRVLWPNTGERFGIPDLRGYDSIIPRWIVATWEAIEDPAPMLPYNRIGNVHNADALASPALAAIGGRYIVSDHTIDDPSLTPIDDGDIKVYENRRAMPRAWLVNTVEVVTGDGLVAALRRFDPGKTVLLEEKPDRDDWRDVEAGRQAFRGDIGITEHDPSRLTFDVFAPRPGMMLVVNEGWFPGWRAFVTPAGAVADGAGAVKAVEVKVYRADGMLRAIPIPPGRSSIELRYFPMSLKLGLYISFIGLVLLFLLLVYAAWARFVRIGDDDAVGRIAVNAFGPMGAALVTKVLQFVYAALFMRILGPDKAGQYYYAVTVYGLIEIVTNFGLGVLVAREIARRPAESARLVSTSVAVRLGLTLASIPALLLLGKAMAIAGHPIDPATMAAIWLLVVALVPGHINAALTSAFQGTERMMAPAALMIVSALLTMTLGALALTMGYGFVGMAAVSVVVNGVTFALLARMIGRSGVAWLGRPDTALVKWMLAASLPLMLNSLLQTLFFKIDILLLAPLQGEQAVGWYSSAYKWVEAFLIIPPYLVMALFPLMSRRAENDRAGLRVAYENTVRWLIAVALPAATLTTFMAEPLIALLAGQDYLPNGARALQILIWFLPFSFINGVTQYVLIALNRQKWITWSFAAATLFNIVANLVIIPRYSYSGAAAVTILSELVLMAPFLWGLRDLGAPPVLALAWQPLLAASGLALALAGSAAGGIPSLIAAPIGLVLYILMLWRLGWLTADDRMILARFRPRRRATMSDEG